MKILHKPLWQVVLLVLGIIVGLVYGLHGIVLIFVSLAGVPSPWYTFCIIDPGIITVIFLLLYRFADQRLFRVIPSMSFAHEYDEGPWIHWREDPKTTITVNWFTRKESPTRVAIGKEADQLEIFEGETGKIHHLTVKNLETGTRYYYKIMDFEKDESVHHFHTAPAGPEPVKLVVLGDTQNGGGTGKDDWSYKPVVESIKQQEFDLFMICGDGTDQGNDLESWHQFLEQSSTIAGNIPMHIAVGNHDTGTRYLMDKGAKNHPDEGANFDYIMGYNYHRPKDQDEITPFQSRYFSFYYGCCFFLVLDTQNSKMAEPRNPQWAYLEEQLSRVPDQYWKIVIVHRDLVRLKKNTNGEHYFAYDGFAKYLLPIFDRHGIHAVFQGHAHNLTAITWKFTSEVPFYNKESGVREHPIHFFTTGGAGKELRKNRSQNAEDVGIPGFHVQENSSHYLLVEIDQNRMSVEAKYPDGSTFFNSIQSKK